MELKKIDSGRLHAIGYDVRARLLQIRLDDECTLQFDGIGENIHYQ